MVDKMLSRIILACCSFFLALSLGAEEQYCNEQMLPSTDPTEFTVNPDGTVSHADIGLMWMSCEYGRTWDGEGCVGDAKEVTIKTALQTAQSLSFAGYEDWRVPTIAELVTIAEISCDAPALNLEIFPEALPKALLWSSTPTPAHHRIDYTPSFRVLRTFTAQVLDFQVDQDEWEWPDEGKYVRFVRDMK